MQLTKKTLAAAIDESDVAEDSTTARLTPDMPQAICHSLEKDETVTDKEEDCDQW